MTPHWTWWTSGSALAAVALGHWLLTGRMFAVSGRYSAIVDRLRFGALKEPDMTEAELIAALREVTREELGADAVGRDPLPSPEARPMKAATPISAHAVFLVSLLVGGALSGALSGHLVPSFTLASSVFPAVFGRAPWTAPVVLLTGGVLVGFGTRMAGGCTSGHGLCGVSRLQRGSLVSTFAFFGTGVLVSLALGRLGE